MHQYTASGDAPILSISSPTLYVTFSATVRNALTDADVTFARNLAAGAVVYAAAVESMHAVHQQRRSDRLQALTPTRSEAPA